MSDITKRCQQCGKNFSVKFKKRAQKFCSRRCGWLARGGKEYNARIARASLVKRAATLRDSGDGKTYRKYMGRHEHRSVAEKLLGRPLFDGEVVHHVDGNVRNNDPSNLRVLTQAEHMREHGLGIKGKPLAHKPWEARWGSK